MKKSDTCQDLHFCALCNILLSFKTDTHGSAPLVIKMSLQLWSSPPSSTCFLRPWELLWRSKVLLYSLPDSGPPLPKSINRCLSESCVEVYRIMGESDLPSKHNQIHRLNGLHSLQVSVHAKPQEYKTGNFPTSGTMPDRFQSNFSVISACERFVKLSAVEEIKWKIPHNESQYARCESRASERLS